MSSRAVTMYGPVLLSMLDPSSMTFAASSLVSASWCCHDSTVPVREHSSCPVAT
eukprot:CAMPEP_0172004738 /NCGR_PEP_ID=MMETSP1041-20130122/4647_1 /TAXON_ID=464988 /ORGANISM="Hemiselmis andersenii, Strain CCMP439" /LENGTH=53 /DNA_ID=CAMNT_0012658633 /DNA_START=261 /DNA_END=419 /DNA_ORIENTATION=+